MGLFKSIGKFFKKVAKVALPVLKLGTSFIPGVGGLVSGLLSSKIGSKAQQLVKTGQQVTKAFPGASGGPVLMLPPTQSIVAMKLAKHGVKVSSMTRVGRAKPKKRKAATKRRTTTRRKPRRLKFGSPAWRKKYLKKRRR